MLKFLKLILVLTIVNTSLFSQQYVGTTPENKNLVLEEFTGVHCPNCPDGHSIAASILASNPNDAFIIAYHPTNSSYTTPYTGEEDYRRVFADAFYSTTYAGARFMPGAFINRKELSNSGDIQKMQSRGDWATYGAGVISEASPVNVGLNATYNNTTKMLTVDVEVYYTSDMNDANTINLVLLENNLQSTQSGATGVYTHKRTFREALTAQWGDAITNTTATSLNTLNFTFDNTTQNYDMTNCEVVAFVYNSVSTEIITGYGMDVAIGTGISDNENSPLTIYPNPTQDIITVYSDNNNIQEVSIYNIVGEKLKTVESSFGSIHLQEYGEGMYILKVTTTDNRYYTQKVAVKY